MHRDGYSPSDDATELPSLAPRADEDHATLNASPLESTRDSQAPLDRLGRFVVLGTLGSGGMGTVLDAYDERLDRSLALKLLHPEMGERHAERLVREAKALARLSHPNVVQVYEVGEAQGRTFIAMEKVSGETLAQWRHTRRGWRECVETYLQAGRGLAAAHEAGLVHRDFKPGNCIVDGDGRVRVLDFGLAREIDVVGESNDARGISPTRRGAVMGTLAYMPLEQLGGLPADERSDQFSFCVSLYEALYEALYGQRPFAGDSVGTLVHALTQGEIRPPPPGRRIPAKLRRALLRGLASDPGDRWPSMQALLAELLRIIKPRPTSWVLAGLGLGIAALVVIGQQWAKSEARCDGARTKLSGVWDPARRDAVKAAILDTKLAYAESTWALVELRLDEYSEAWVEAHTEVCEATTLRGEQSAEVMDLRMACLGSRLIDLGETADVLTSANETLLRRAIDLVGSLPSLSRCDDVTALRALIALPEDPKTAKRVEAMRIRLSRVRALSKVGDYERSSTEAQSVVDEAEVLGYPPLLAEAALRLGIAHQNKGHYDDAERELERAYLMAVEHTHDRVASIAATTLIYVVGERQSEPQLGLQWGKTALALSRRPTMDREVEARVLHSIGTLLQRQGDLDEARTRLLGALELKKAVLGDDDPAVANTLNNLGNLSTSQGLYDEALLRYRQALAIKEAAFGGDHPTVAISLTNIGNALISVGKLEEARVELQRALTILEHSLGPEHPHVASLLVNLAALLEREDRVDEALVLYRRAIAIDEVALGSEHPRLANLRSLMAKALERAGDDEGALAQHRRALAILDAALAPDPRNVALISTSVATLLLEGDSPGLAREPAERALTILDQEGASPATLASACFLLARALWIEPDQRGRARGLAKRALEGFGEKDDPSRGERAAVRAWLDEHPVPATR